MTFIYVSGMGTDSSEKGRIMWARVKGETENALTCLPFRAVYLFRPAAIQPLDGVVPKNPWLKVLLAVTSPLFPLFMRLFPKYVTTSREVGRAMIHTVRGGFSSKWVENWDIRTLGRPPGEGK